MGKIIVMSAERKELLDLILQLTEEERREVLQRFARYKDGIDEDIPLF